MATKIRNSSYRSEINEIFKRRLDRASKMLFERDCGFRRRDWVLLLRFER